MIMDIYKLECGIFDTAFREELRSAGRTFTSKNTGRLQHGILYLRYGAIEFFDIDYKSILKAGSGDLVYIPKGEKYIISYVEETAFSLINFDAKTSVGDDVILSPEIEIVVRENKDSEMIMIFDEVKRFSSEEGAITAFKRKEIIYRLFAYLIGRVASVDTRISGGVKILEERFLENVPISEIAAATYVSESNFRKIFAKQFGMSPIQYRNALRLKRAMALLRDGEYTVSEIAELTGFCNESYFCRSYKKAFGVTPKYKEKGTS